MKSRVYNSLQLQYIEFYLPCEERKFSAFYLLFVFIIPSLSASLTSPRRGDRYNKKNGGLTPPLFQLFTGSLFNQLNTFTPYTNALDFSMQLISVDATVFCSSKVSSGNIGSEITHSVFFSVIGKSPIL